MERKTERRKPMDWRWAISQQARSGLTIRAWCGQEGVSESAFYRGRRKVMEAAAPTDGRTGAKTRQSPMRFWPVRVADDLGDESRIEIVLADGSLIRVHGAVDRQSLRGVLDVLADSGDPNERRVLASGGSSC